MQDGGAAYISSQYAVFILSVDGERFLPEAVGNAPQSYGKLQYKLFKQNDLWHVLRDKLSTDIFLSDVKRFFASGVESGLVEGRLALVLGYLKSRSHDQTLADFAQGLTGFIRENHMALKDISILQDIETAVDLLQLPGVSTFNIEQGDYVLLTIAEDLDAEDSAEALKILTFNKRKSEVSKSEAASMRFYLVKNPDNNMQYNLFCGVTSDALQMVRRETVERNGYGIEIFVLGDSTFFDENSLVFNNDDEEAVFELYGSKNALFVKNLGTIDDMKNNTHLSRLEKQEKGFVFKSAMGELIDYDHGSRDYVGKGGEGIDFKLVAPVVATVAEEVPEEEVVVPEVVVVELKLDALEDVLSALRKNDKNYSQTEDIFVALWNQIYQEGYRIDEAGEAFSVVKPKLKKDLVKDHEDVLKQIKNKIHFDYKNNQKTVDDDSVTTKLNSLFSENDVSDLAPLIHRVLKELSALKPSFLTEVKTLQQLMSASNYDDAKVKVADLLAWAKEIKTTASKDAKIEVGAMLSNAPGVSSVDRSDRATVAAIFSALKNINSFLVSGKAVKVQTISSMASTSFQSSVVQPVAPKATASSATSRTAPASTRGRRGRAKGRDEVERVTQAEN
jgi:hypothetical protein